VVGTDNAAVLPTQEKVFYLFNLCMGPIR